MISKVLFLSLILGWSDPTPDFELSEMDPTSVIVPHSVFVIPVNFQDRVASTTIPTLTQKVQDMASGIESSSYGLAPITATVVPRFYLLPHSTAYYGNWQNRRLIASDALESVRNDYGDVIHAYSHVIYFFPTIPGWGQGGYSDTNQVWINGGSCLWLLTHEMGHQFGLFHAQRWMPCNLGNPVDHCGVFFGYQDCFDVMTNYQPGGRDFSSFEKYRLGWIAPEQIKNVTSTGIYRIYRFDDPSASSFPGLVLSFPQPGTERTYFVSYRYTPVGARNGAYVTWEDGVRSILIDRVPSTGCTDDAILPVGATLNDTGVRITPVRTGGTTPGRWIDIQITL